LPALRLEHCEANRSAIARAGDSVSYCLRTSKLRTYRTRQSGHSPIMDTECLTKTKT